MTIAIGPLLVMVIGLLVYALSSNVKVSEMGRLAYAIGLLVSLIAVAHTLRL